MMKKGRREAAYMPCDFNDEELKAALQRLDDAFIDSLPEKDDLEYKFSNDFEIRMQELINQTDMQKINNTENTKRRIFKLIKISKKVAMIIISVILIFASAMSVTAVRKTVFDMIYKVYHKYTEVFGDVSSNTHKIQFIERRPKYIPEGFVLDVANNKEYIRLWYTNESDSIYYEQKPINIIERHINLEGIEMENLRFKGNKAQYYSNRGVQTLMWIDDNYMYTILSTISKEEIIKIAESVYTK